MAHRVTLSAFLLNERRKTPALDPALAGLIKDIEVACKYIAAAVSRGKLAEAKASTRINIQGEEQKPLDVIANELVLQTCESCEHLLGVVSEELEGPYPIPESRDGRYLLVYDPLDGSSNLDLNVTVGSIFSVLRAPEGVKELKPEHFLQPGVSQVAAAFSLYGPSVMLVLTLGRGVHGFTLDREVGTFFLTHPDLRIPEDTREFAINASNERFWEPPVRHYVEECKLGKSGPRGVDFNMRWVASMVAEVFRILIRGGVFLYPRDTKDPSKGGRLRLLYEANPMSLIVEQAGGASSTGRERILEVQPTELHQRIPVILGSRNEVERLVRYHQAYDRGEDLSFKSPLFASRSIYKS
ncbi:Fructose-1,6-bisphosphatase class 1 [Methylacidimicrobium sp. AP8]|uniref:class 1 fructose-bisphosphatase n=1 Tax=Methylacidimicrobium sp. AP8 TaxID=2730359 RepID=UPI0018C09DFB|nr:class 1 fructose-bisphosphatase [Methylacidimicrobium sp. AP8]CAB4243971.1 Fructose-1,6-bisphosphatase class 1 [Methylacidimicrobium sp. AP8]